MFAAYQNQKKTQNMIHIGRFGNLQERNAMAGCWKLSQELASI